jgi:hypothetical protein
MGRIDRYLDGELDRTALTAEEREAAEPLETAIDEAREYVAAPPAPDLTTAVMSRVAAARPAPLSYGRAAARRLGVIFWTSRKVSLWIRPAYGLLVLVILAGAARQWSEIAARNQPVNFEVPGPPSFEVLVQFRVEAPRAGTVRLAGSFTNWEARFELHEVAPGIWSAVLPVPLGVHDYAFLIDGTRWIADPYAPQVNDGFGGTNSRLALVPARRPQT